MVGTTIATAAVQRPTRKGSDAMPTSPSPATRCCSRCTGSGTKSKMTGHGFRAVASTVLNEAGFRPDVVERQLAHQEGNAVRAAYHRSEY